MNQPIPGIGNELTQRLSASGIKTAADISGIKISQQGYGYRVRDVAYIEVPGRGKVHVEGIGPVKAKSLLVWRQQLEGAFTNSLPRSLPESEINAIKAKYLAQRRSFDAQTANEQQRAVQTTNSMKNKYDNEIKLSEKQLADVKIMFAKQART